MKKIKQFFSKKLNIFALLVILIATGFGGYQAYISANDDFACTRTEIHLSEEKITLKDKVVGGCVNISWGEWKKVKETDTKIFKEREGVGVKTIINYSKIKSVSKQKSKLTGTVYGAKGGKDAGRYDLTKEECEEWGGVFYDNIMGVNVNIGNKGLCVKEVGEDICGDFNYIDSTTSSTKNDSSIRNDSSAKTTKSFQVCRVIQKDNTCKDTSWTPSPETQCGTFTQVSDCGNTREATGTKPKEECNSCSDTIWLPKKEDVCDGVHFIQKLCDNEQDAVGAKKDCGGDCKEDWYPAADTVCVGTMFTQTKCNSEQEVEGTKTDGTCLDNYCETHPDDEACDDDSDPDPDPDPQGPIDAKLSWSKDKIHWNPDFDKVILLKSKREKIYIKDTPEVGSICNQNANNWWGLFSSKLPNTDGHSSLLDMGEVDTTNGYVLPLQPNDSAPIGEVFNQKVQVKYCGDASKEEKTLKVKIVNMSQQEI